MAKQTIRLDEINEEIARLKSALREKEEELQKFMAEAEKNEVLFRTLMETAVGKIGQDFFDNIVAKLSEWLNAECIIIGQKVDENTVRGVPMYLEGKTDYNFHYHLQGTPCDMTSKKGYCVYPYDVRSIFPTSKDLIELNAQGYIGVALYDKEGNANGVICGISKNRLNLHPQAELILKIIGARVSAEIEREKAQAALQQSEVELRESNATKDKFFSVIAHDLKGSFNSILGFSNLLMANYEKFDPEKQKKLIGQLAKSSNHAYALLENLLTWSMAQRGLIEFSPKEVQLSKLVNDVLDQISNQSAEKNISICQDIPENILVKVDLNMISTVFRNLLTNAIKFSHPGGDIQIYVLENKTIPKYDVVVEDHGIGILPENLSKLFSTDQNASTPGTNSEKGTGLGLIICKDFIEKHGESIRVESNHNQGSKFIFTLQV